MSYTWWVWYDQETYHLFLALLSERLDYKEGISNNQTPRDLKAIFFFFFDKQTTGRGGKSMIKRRRVFSSRWSSELSWTRRAAGRDAGSGWFLALGTSLDPLLPRCHCHTRARRHLGWTQSLHGAHTSLLKSKRNGGKTAGGISTQMIWWSLFRKWGRILRVSGDAESSPGVVLESEMRLIRLCISALPPVTCTALNRPLQLS